MNGSIAKEAKSWIPLPIKEKSSIMAIGTDTVRISVVRQPFERRVFAIRRKE